MSIRSLAPLWALLLCQPASAQEADLYPGPYRGQVVRVIDADTIEIDVRLWPGLTARYAVRERGIDAPETYRPACEDERAWGEEATAFIQDRYSAGSLVEIDNVEEGTYGGRVLANIGRRTASGVLVTLQAELLERGLAVEWTPDRDDVPWCLLARTRD